MDSDTDLLLDILLEEEEEEDDDEAAPIMDIDDIELGPEEGEEEAAIDEDEEAAPDEEGDAQPSEVVLSDILRRGETSGGEWTHLVRRPDTYRCCVTQPQDAKDLYRTVWRYAQAGLCVMERRLSPVTRCSIAIEIHPHHLPATRLAEQDLVRRAAGVITADLRDSLGTQLPARAFACLVLCPATTAGGTPLQEIWLHWPAVAVANTELTTSWCNQLWGSALAPACAHLRPRNTESHVPMYSCAIGEEDAPMLVTAVVDENGVYRANWMDWFLRTADLHEVLFIGNGERWPRTNVDEARVHRLLPLVCSINPMGTPCTRLRLPAPSSLATGRAVEEAAGLRRLLDHLGEPRRRSRIRSNEVGQAVYQLGRGADWAMEEWVRWCTPAPADGDARSAAELAFEWRSFAQGDPGTDARSLLYEMVQEDNGEEAVRAFLLEQRTGDHLRRQASEGTLFGVLGSATHHDLAQFIKHELRSVAVCSSLIGHGVWYVYHRDRHRWVFDPEGADVLVWCLQILRDEMDRLRTEINCTAERVVDQRQLRGMTRTPPFPRLANFPNEGASEVEIHKAILVHMDTIIGDVRHMQSVVRYLGKLVTNRTFADQLDVKNEHLIPFANGVLDLDRLELRPGLPSDMILRGPTYPWVDFPEADGDIEELERMLTQIFTDRVVLAFFLEMGGTWLRRRNRFKHFYIFTGNTNGGKSLLFSMVKMAFSTMCGLLPIQAITGKDTDASAHSDYLARTHGQALCVCNEPDSSTQLLMADKVKVIGGILKMHGSGGMRMPPKVMTSDTDHLAVRHLYGATRDMPITWKLVLLCNSVPRYSQLDGAAVERTQFIPCNSTFVSEKEAPVTEDQQYRHSRFVRRDIPPSKQKELARRLMAMFFAAYCQHGMHRSSYSLLSPPRIRQESNHQLQELSVFRMYLRAFLRPCATPDNSVLSLAGHRAVTEACQTILSAYEQWLQQGDNKDLAEQPWYLLSEAAQNPIVQGSPGWVRCQCVHLMHFCYRHCGKGDMLHDLMSQHQHDSFTTLTISYVDAAFVADQFNRYRRQHRVFLNRPMTNGNNTFEAGSNEPSEAGDAGRPGGGGGCRTGGARGCGAAPWSPAPVVVPAASTCRSTRACGWTRRSCGT